MWQQNFASWLSLNASANIYKNTINGFTVENKYPVLSVYTSETEKLTSGNFKVNSMFHFPKQLEMQLSTIYLAPDIIPQGKIGARFSVDIGMKKGIQKGKGELFLNASDILNTLKIEKSVNGNGFRYETTDYYETQVFRVGYSYKF